MLILASTSQLIRVVTDAATDVDVFASYVDRNGSTFTPGNNAGVMITTATTTTVVTSPAGSTERNIKGMTIRNRDTTTVGITVQWYNGVTAITLLAENLDPGKELTFDSAGGWTLQDRLPSVTRTVIPGDPANYGQGVYFTPKGVVSLFVECVGRGGVGGGCTTAATNSAAAGGGSAGGYVTGVVNNPDPTYQWLTDSPSTTNHVVFGVTAWDTPDVAGIVVACNGVLGDSDAVGTIHTGGTGGHPTTNSITSPVPEPGETGVALAAAQAMSGRGGSGPYGHGGGSICNTTSKGNPATGHGAGGGGACIISGGASQNGGAGSPSLIIVTEFYQC